MAYLSPPEAAASLLSKRQTKAILAQNPDYEHLKFSVLHSGVTLAVIEARILLQPLVPS